MFGIHTANNGLKVPFKLSVIENLIKNIYTKHIKRPKESL